MLDEILDVKITRTQALGTIRIFARTPEGYLLAIKVGKDWDVPGGFLTNDEPPETQAINYFTKMVGTHVDGSKLHELLYVSPNPGTHDNFITVNYIYETPISIDRLPINAPALTVIPVPLHALSKLPNWDQLEQPLKEWLYG